MAQRTFAKLMLVCYSLIAQISGKWRICPVLIDQYFLFLLNVVKKNQSSQKA
jgi:hypothetical protein